MDLLDAMNIWTEIGGQIANWDKGKGKPFIILFMWENKVEGTLTTHPGSGFSWDWPQRLLDAKKAYQECVLDRDPTDDYCYEG